MIVGVVSYFVIVGCAAFTGLSPGPCVFFEAETCARRAVEISAAASLPAPVKCHRRQATARGA